MKCGQHVSSRPVHVLLAPGMRVVGAVAHHDPKIKDPYNQNDRLSNAMQKATQILTALPTTIYNITPMPVDENHHSKSQPLLCKTCKPLEYPSVANCHTPTKCGRPTLETVVAQKKNPDIPSGDKASDFCLSCHCHQIEGYRKRAHIVTGMCGS